MLLCVCVYKVSVSAIFYKNSCVVCHWMNLHLTTFVLIEAFNVFLIMPWKFLFLWLGAHMGHFFLGYPTRDRIAVWKGVCERHWFSHVLFNTGCLESFKRQYLFLVWISLVTTEVEHLCNEYFFIACLILQLVRFFSSELFILTMCDSSLLICMLILQIFFFAEKNLKAHHPNRMFVFS